MLRLPKPCKPWHVAPGARAIVWQATEQGFNREHFARQTLRVPERLHVPLARRYASTLAAEGYRAANLQILDMGELCAARGLDLIASDSDLREQAREHAERCGRMMYRGVSNGGLLRDQLTAYCEGRGVRPPESRSLAGFVARCSSDAWWRRALRRSTVREAERIFIGLGLVHRRASLYASAEAVARRVEQRARNAAMLKATEAENERGDVLTLAELSARNVSNPAVRRAELMTRIRGFEEFATAAGHSALFVTWTTPSRMHARLAATGDANPKHDGTTPREAQGYLVRQWARARAALARKGVHVYGFRVAEPHHDGTPHWHLLLFVARAAVQWVVDKLRKYACQIDAGELTSEAAQSARFKSIPIEAEKGTAAGYVAKYVAKNIDGFQVGDDMEAAPGVQASESVRHVDAWAATWGIRQFQQVGGPGVTIWRELRRLRDKPQGELFGDFWEAADAGEWCRYVALMGGIEIKRADRPLQLWRCEPVVQGRDDERGRVGLVPLLTSYGEARAAEVRGVQFQGVPLITRTHQWTVRPCREGVGFRVSWTRVNNCTSEDANAGASSTDSARAGRVPRARGAHCRS